MSSRLPQRIEETLDGKKDSKRMSTIDKKKASASCKKVPMARWERRVFSNTLACQAKQDDALIGISRSDGRYVRFSSPSMEFTAWSIKLKEREGVGDRGDCEHRTKKKTATFFNRASAAADAAVLPERAFSHFQFDLDKLA